MKFYLLVLISLSFLGNKNLKGEHINERELFQTEGLYTYSQKIDDVLFHFHHKKSQDQFLKESLNIALESFPKLHRYFNYKPKTEVHILISDKSVVANGLASVFPRNTIVLNNYPPTGQGFLSFSKDWIKVLLVHEYTHIITLEMTRGLWSFARFFIGSTAKVSGILPLWISEGVATWAESKFTGEGRLNNPSAKKMLYQIAWDEKACHHIHCLDHFKIYPYGHAPYIIGAFFLDFLEQKNPGFFRCFFNQHSRSIPFFLHGIFKECTGESASSSLAQFWKKTRSSHPKPQALTKTKIRGHIDWTSGVLENEKWKIFLVFPYHDSHPLSQSQKFIYVLNKASGQGKSYKSKYFLQSIYWSNREKNLIGANFLEKNFKGTRRNTIVYKLTGQGKLTPEKIKEKTGHYLFYKNGQWKELKYEKSQWTLDQKPIGQILENISSPKKAPKKINKPYKISRKKYKAWKYLSPNYLMFLYSYSGELPFLQASTSLADPYGKHRLDLNLQLYGKVLDSTSPLTFGAYYQYDFSNYWHIGLGYQGTLSRTQESPYTNKSESLLASMGKSFLGDYVKNKVYLSISQGKEKDFLFNEIRRTQGLSLTWETSYRSRNFQSFLKESQLSLTGLYQNVRALNSQFAGVKGKLNFLFNIGRKGRILWNSYYAQYFKDKFKDGAFYLGGANSTLTGQYQFPSYIFSYQEGFGNQLGGSRLEFQGELGRPYWGKGFFPAFWKSWNILLGGEFAFADYLQGKRNSHAFSGFIGTGFNLTAAYNFPLKLKLVYSRTLGSSPYKNQFLFLLDAPLFP